MLFNSTEFLFFLPAVFAVYWLLQSKLRWQNLFVVTASYLFYGWWDWKFLLLIAFTSACSFASGLIIGDSHSRYRKAALVGNIAVNLAILGLFKYYDFFAAEFARLLKDAVKQERFLESPCPFDTLPFFINTLPVMEDLNRQGIKDVYLPDDSHFSHPTACAVGNYAASRITLQP